MQIPEGNATKNSQQQNNQNGQERARGGGKDEGRGPTWWTMLRQFGLTIAIFVLLMLTYNVYQEDKQKEKVVAISELSKQILASEIKSITIIGTELQVQNIKDEKYKSQKDASESLETTLSKYGVSALDLQKIEIKNQNDESLTTLILNILPFLLPFLIIGFFLMMISRQLGARGMNMLSFGQSKAKIIYPDDNKEKKTFKDVAGAKEAKQELTEIVDFLKNPEKFIDIGATIPKGVLLMGSPGTGKTLLARAVAGEAAVPFFHLSGSEFVEMFVGVGASRVRDLFFMAKKEAPAIIFIDEIDAIGRMRGTGLGGGNDEREQTLNQILVEMDGFAPNEKVIVIAATNRSEVLDPALVRPGRFDRRVMLDLPDRKDRVEILKVQSTKKPLAEDVDLEEVAKRTPGFSGADLYSLMNEAAILSVRKKIEADTKIQDQGNKLQDVSKNKNLLDTVLDKKILGLLNVKVVKKTPDTGSKTQEIIEQALERKKIDENPSSKIKISQADIIASIEKVMMGPERKSHLMSQKEKELTAYHEAGHALVGSVLPYADPVHKISIISRGNAGGYTMSLPTDDRKLHSRKSFIDEIAMTLGGYAAEELIYGDITTGPQGDLQQVTLKARDMVVRYGMSEKVGPRALEIVASRKATYDDVNKEHSPALKQMVDEEVEKLVRQGLETARKVVREYKKVLDDIAKKLMEVENLEKAEFEEILKANNIAIKTSPAV